MARSIAYSCLALLVAGAASSGADPNWVCPLSARPKLAGDANAAPGTVGLHAHVSAANISQNSTALTVVAVDANSLTKMVREGDKDILVAFYAPWCPHCKTFVMADKSGDPSKAPLELLSREIVAANGPQVVKFDVEKNQVPRSLGFQVNYIPRIYLVSRNGALVAYESDPHDTEKLKAFALSGATAAGNHTSLVLTQSLRARRA